ncbi:MAG: hypothetical protein ACXVDD_23935 [Polyangia bacterium]
MTRIVMAMALAATLAGCDEKKDAPATTPPAAPVSGAAVAPSGAAVAPSGAAVAPSGAAVAPSGAAVSGEAAKPVDDSAKHETAKGDKAAVKPAGKLPPPGGMPHGKPEDGTLKYNPPPSQNAPAKKGDTAP